MINKTKVALGLFLVLLLSGCGQSQTDIACEAFKSGDSQATLKEFEKLYIQDPNTEAALKSAKYIVFAEQEIGKARYVDDWVRTYKLEMQKSEITLIKFCL